MDKIINLFLENPEKDFHVREIARLVKKSPTTISKYLKEFSKKKILIQKKELNHLLFKANNENTEYKRLKINYSLKNINESGIIDFLEEEFNYPKAIVVFGSVAKGEDGEKSDLDLFILSSLKKDLNLKKFENKLNKKVQFFVHSKQDLKKLNKELLNNICNGIVIYGHMEVF